MGMRLSVMREMDGYQFIGYYGLFYLLLVLITLISFSPGIHQSLEPLVGLISPTTPKATNRTICCAGGPMKTVFFIFMGCMKASREGIPSVCYQINRIQVHRAVDL